MYSASLLRFDINGYTKNTKIEEQYEMTQKLIALAEEHFRSYDHFLSMRSFAGDEVIQTIFDEKIPMMSATDIFNLAETFVDKAKKSNLKLKGCVILHQRNLDGSPRSVAGVNFNDYQNGTLVCSDSDYQIMKKNNRGELGRFIGIPLVLSARLLSVSKILNTLIVANIPYRSGKNFIYNHEDNLTDFHNIDADLIDSLDLEEKVITFIQLMMSKKYGVKLYGPK